MNEGLDEFFEGVKMALDPLYTFGVKQVPPKQKTKYCSTRLSWTVSQDLAEKLNKRELTGHAARDAIELTMGVATAEQWNGFYRRILIKDLRCGVSEKTVNNVAKKNKFPNIHSSIHLSQLAHDPSKTRKESVWQKDVRS